MAMSYEVLAQRRGQIQGRCLIAVLKYAVYIQNEAANTANHVNRLAWSNIAMASPDAEAAVALAWVFGNQTFLDTDIGITDAALQGIVETAINAKRITP